MDAKVKAPGQLVRARRSLSSGGLVWLVLIGLGLRLAPEVGAAEPAPQAYTWSTVTMGGGGLVSGLVAHPLRRGLLYARTDVGGAYRWQEDEQRWQPLTDWVGEREKGLLGVESLAVDPQDPARVFMLAGTAYWNGGRSAILRSLDAGASWRIIDVTAQWRAHGNGLGRQSGEKLAVDPHLGSVVLCGTRTAGLFRSADSGDTWQAVAGFPVAETPSGNGVAFVLFDSASGSPGRATPTLYAGVSRLVDNLWTSRDAGASWSLVPGAPVGLMPQRAIFAGGGRLYLTYADGVGPHGGTGDEGKMRRGAIWRYAPADGAWTEVTPAGAEPAAYGAVAVAADDPRRLVATTINLYRPQSWGYGDKILVSKDAGASWSDLFATGAAELDAGEFPWIKGHAIHWAGSVVIDPFDARRVFVASGNGVFRTDDLDAARSRWVFSVRGMEETVPLAAVSVRGGPLVSVVGDYDGFVHDDIRRSPARGNHQPAMGTTQALAVAAQAPLTLARAGRALQLSFDGGATWEETQTKPEPQAAGGGLAWSADGQTLVWCPAGQATFYRTTDRGKTWQAAQGPEGGGRPVADAVNPRRFYFYETRSGRLWASEDAAATFANVGATEPGGSDLLRVDLDREGCFWIALGRGGLAVTEDGGRTVRALPAVREAWAVGTGKAAPGGSRPTLYLHGRTVSGETGVHRSTDLGGAWVRVDDDRHRFGGLGNGRWLIGDETVFGRVYFGTVGRGIVVGEPVGP